MSNEMQRLMDSGWRWQITGEDGRQWFSKDLAVLVITPGEPLVWVQAVAHCGGYDMLLEISADTDDIAEIEECAARAQRAAALLEAEL